ncbi:MAG: RidA family protein [Nocardioidaceae bacterium]
MSVQRVNPPSLAPARGFTHAVVAHGPTVFLAGQTALDGTGRIIDGNVAAQFEQALGNLLEALRAAGGRPEQLVTLTVYAVDLEDYQAHAGEIGRVWRRLVGSTYPAMAAVGVVRLWDLEARVEVQGTAVLDPRG